MLKEQKDVKDYSNPNSNNRFSAIETMRNSLWYKGFGGDWICQIQQYHHFIHNRVIFVTGATGAGKSTIFPFIMLYAYKMINYNNNAKIICTAPRIKPVRENANRIAGSLGVEIRENNINEIQYYTSKDKNTSDDFYHPTLRFVTDGSFVKSLVHNYILKDVYEDTNIIIKKNDIKNNEITDENYIDMLLVDESHENNTYITMLLTLVKFAVYINNSVSLGIISATMEYDEIIYRTYYKTIDDNYKYPLNVYNKNNNINRNLLDRRVHLSKPFNDTNFLITEYPYNPNKTKFDILKEILSTSKTGDILIFEPGSQEVKKTVSEINNSSFCPRDVIAIPYYSNMNDELKEIIDHIDNVDVRQNFRFPKKYNIFDYGLSDITLMENEMENIGTYTRFIIVATNIVEASVTINSLSYVIDTGEHKKNIYDIKTHKSILKKSYIAIQNRTQRKGRVGRSSVGFFYQTYDTLDLSIIGNYLIITDDITNEIINIITIVKDKVFDNNRDPYKSKNIGELKRMPFIIKQYTYNDYKSDNNSQEVIFTYPKIDVGEIVYPYSDGKYDYVQLADEKFIFYIIHPNNFDLERDENNKIILPVKKYINKIKDIFKFLKSFNLVDANNSINNLGISIFKLLKIFEPVENENTKTIRLNDLYYFLHCYAFKKNNIKLYNSLVHNGIIKWIFSNITNVNIKLDKRIDTKCDFIAKSKLIPSKYYDMDKIRYNYLKEYENVKIDEYIMNKNIDNYISRLTYNVLRNSIIPKEMIRFYNTILSEYNIMKIKLQYIFENIEKYNLSSINFDTSIFGLDKYTIFSYLLVQYYPENLLEKLKGIDLYQNYYNKDINNLYKILSIKYEDGKQKIITNVSREYRQLILYLTIDEENNVQNIMYIPSQIFKYLNKPIIIECTKLLKETINKNNIKKKVITENVITEKYLIEKINPEFMKNIYEIIKFNT